MNRKRGVNNNNNNKLLYDPNQRQQKRLGAFSMDENNNKEEEQNTNTKTSANTNTNENSNNELNNNQNELENKKEDTNNTTEQSDNESGEDENKTLLGGKRTVAGRVAAKVLMFLLANPVTWLFLGVFFLILIIVVILGGGADTGGTSGSLMGLNGYPYYELNNYCEKVKVTYTTDDNKKVTTGELDFETEYIPAVVNAEVGNMQDSPETLQAVAIAARTYAMYHINRDGDCHISGESGNFQSFTQSASEREEITQADHPIMQAVMATYGLVMIRNDTIFASEYDNGCYRGETADSYILGYGKTFYDGIIQLQYIPKSWAESSDAAAFMKDIYKAENDNEGNCWGGGHGRGLEQYGAYYLTKTQGYTVEEVLDYYYNIVDIYSIYPTVSSNYTLSTSEGLNDVITSSLRYVLESMGTSVEAFNDYMLSEIINAGIGTRDAAVVSAVSMVAGLYQYYGIRIPYAYGGQHGRVMDHNGVDINRTATTFYGVDPNWGSRITPYTVQFENGSTTYYYYGPDCSGFISQVLYNAGFDNDVATSGTQGNYGPKRSLTENGRPTGQPGDLMWHEGHIMMIVGVDEAAQVYYIAHASGGKQGVKINSVSFSESGEYVVDMTEWYANNALEITDEEFIERFRNGYVDGYTNEYEVDLPVTSSDILFVGDSRTVGLCNVNALCDSTSSCSTNTCLASTGAGYSWFSNQITTIENSARTNIVINMGVNDLVGNANGVDIAQRYFDLIEQMAINEPDKNFYIMSVNPVDEGENVSNTTIRNFNIAMTTYVANTRYDNIFYLGASSSVMFTTTDGLHYDNTTYLRLYRYVLGRVG